jgi:hypothetical protein
MYTSTTTVAAISLLRATERLSKPYKANQPAWYYSKRKNFTGLSSPKAEKP